MPTKSTRKPRTASKNKTPSFISRHEVYTLAELAKRLGVSERVIKQAREDGLPAKLVGGKRIVIRGADADDWLADHAPDAELPKKEEE